MILAIILFLLLCYVPVVLALTFTPLIAKRNIFFGITIPIEQREHDQVKQIRRAYLRDSVIMAVLTLIAFFVLKPYEEKSFTIAILVASFFPLVYHTVLYLIAYYRTKQLKQQMGWATQEQISYEVVQPNITNEQRPVLSNVWYVLPLVIIFLTVSHLVTIYDTLPERIITHYDITGTPDGFSEKSFFSVFGLSFVQIFMIGLFLFVNWMVKASKYQLEPTNPSKSWQNTMQFRRLSSIFMYVLCLIIVLFFAIMQLQTVYEVGSDMVLATIIAELVLTTLVVVVFVMKALRLKRGPHTKETTVTSMDQDQYWKLGGFYYNPHDPAWIVEKRMGIGWTFNFAHPISWFVLLGTLVAVGLLTLFLSTIQ